MARINRTNDPVTFTQLHATSRSMGENNDCSVKAIAIACDTPYAEVLALMTRLGRKPGHGTPFSVSRAAIRALGYSIREWSFMEIRAMVRTYPGAHKNLHSITTHHPRRFPAAWKGCHRNMIWSSNNHMLAVKDGAVVDWSINRALSIRCIWEIEKA